MTDKNSLLEYLMTFLTEHRKALFLKIIKNRIKHLTVVLEDIYQPQNASAILRTCDCLGIQDVHIIENINKYKINPDVALGSYKWLTLIKYNNTSDNTRVCFEHLRSEGYKIIATTPHKDGVSDNDLSIDNKTALVFGQELRGLSENALSLADGFVKIPMYGFTESFNISVSAAILLKTLTDRLRNSKIHWSLSEDERNDILLNWTRNSIKQVKLIEKDFIENRNKK